MTLCAQLSWRGAGRAVFPEARRERAAWPAPSGAGVKDPLTEPCETSLTPPHSVPHFWVPGCRSTSLYRAASRRHVQLRATKKTYDSFDAMIRDDSTPILVDFYGETAA